jgi:dihydrofolate synthase/folylpolyglutamate synthase
MDLSLDRMHRVLSELGDPCSNTPAVQVVGTNGKGSIACMIHSGLSAAGVRSGLTTSPHLVSWCERICVNQKSITLVELHQRLQALEPFAEQHQLTTFERLITAAFCTSKPTKWIGWCLRQDSVAASMPPQPTPNVR